MKRVLVAVVVAVSCMACQSAGDIDEVEKTLSSIEADLNEP